MNEHYVINLGRQLGSGGKEIGEKLAKELGIAFYDKELINLASKESGLCKEFFEKADEKASQSLLGGLFGSRFPFITEGAYPYNSYLSNDSLFKIQSDVIRQLAEQQSCLFVGRCADYILRDHPRCCNVFVSASPEARIERLMRLHHIRESGRADGESRQETLHLLQLLQLQDLGSRRHVSLVHRLIGIGHRRNNRLHQAVCQIEIAASLTIPVPTDYLSVRTFPKE